MYHFCVHIVSGYKICIISVTIPLLLGPYTYLILSEATLKKESLFIVISFTRRPYPRNFSEFFFVQDFFLVHTTYHVYIRLSGI